jgi:predicted patatin/cPLA2 family phospholipase
MGKKRLQMESKQDAYEQSRAVADAAEQEGCVELQILSDRIQERSFLMEELTRCFARENKIRQHIATKKQEIKQYKQAWDRAQQDYEASRQDVSKALRKLEKYQLISLTLG